MTDDDTDDDMDDAMDDDAAIALVLEEFFAAFDSGPGLTDRMGRLRSLFLPGAVVVKTCGAEPVALTVEGFVAPREALLAGDTLVGFREWSVEGRTEVHGDVASHVCRYAKSWEQGGIVHQGAGAKALHLVRTATGWRISALAWDDDR